MIIGLQEIEDAAKTKPPGWREAVLAAGQVNRGLLHISRARFAALSVSYAQLGDAVATAAKPIARAVDRVAKTNLAGCGGCAKRHQKWNGGAKAV